MIKYALECSNGHAFEGWFGNSADYDRQEEDGLLACPHCGDSSIGKALMAPAIAKKRGSQNDQMQAFKLAAEEKVKAIRAHVEKHYENVGASFPEEARKIHYGEAEERGIYGEASPKECVDLMEEGITIAPLPADSVKSEKLN